MMVLGLSLASLLNKLKNQGKSWADRPDHVGIAWGVGGISKQRLFFSASSNLMNQVTSELALFLNRGGEEKVFLGALSQLNLLPYEQVTSES